MEFLMLMTQKKLVKMKWWVLALSLFCLLSMAEAGGRDSDGDGISDVDDSDDDNDGVADEDDEDRDTDGDGTPDIDDTDDDNEANPMTKTTTMMVMASLTLRMRTIPTLTTKTTNCKVFPFPPEIIQFDLMIHLPNCSQSTTILPFRNLLKYCSDKKNKK